MKAFLDIINAKMRQTLDVSAVPVSLTKKIFGDKAIVTPFPDGKELIIKGTSVFKSETKEDGTQEITDASGALVVQIFKNDDGTVLVDHDDKIEQYRDGKLERRDYKTIQVVEYYNAQEKLIREESADRITVYCYDGNGEPLLGADGRQLILTFPMFAPAKMETKQEHNAKKMLRHNKPKTRITPPVLGKLERLAIKDPHVMQEKVAAPTVAIDVVALASAAAYAGVPSAAAIDIRTAIAEVISTFTGAVVHESRTVSDEVAGKERVTHAPVTGVVADDAQARAATSERAAVRALIIDNAAEGEKTVLRTGRTSDEVRPSVRAGEKRLASVDDMNVATADVMPASTPSRVATGVGYYEVPALKTSLVTYGGTIPLAGSREEALAAKAPNFPYIPTSPVQGSRAPKIEKEPMIVADATDPEQADYDQQGEGRDQQDQRDEEQSDSQEEFV